MKIALGTFVCRGIEAQLGSDVAAAARAALADYTQRVEAGLAPTGIPKFFRESAAEDTARTFELPVDADTRATLEREAARQGATVSQLATHSVMVYLAELDRTTPLSAA